MPMLYIPMSSYSSLMDAIDIFNGAFNCIDTVYLYATCIFSLLFHINANITQLISLSLFSIKIKL